jgi:hypothetical protein
MLINGHRVEIKFSTLWQEGIYNFQQIRDQNYEYAVCLGISPFEAHCETTDAAGIAWASWKTSPRMMATTAFTLMMCVRVAACDFLPRISLARCRS